ncbi:hypothetical protein [Lysinibacillus capsici]|uniref:hypothetical protein n=1 Tax=Lysinibacillus capsici TaxID=2115968 RepID=UPI002898EA79|nr:hypothetical protein [Lysinibacillus capsici]
MNKNARLISYSFIVLLLIFVLLLLTILIAYIVYNTFADWETIIAGCIGFVGAILGGLLTLLGVRITIKETRRDREKELLPKKITTINYERSFISKTLLEIEYLDVDDPSELYLYSKSKTEEVHGKISDPNIYYLGSELFGIYADILKTINIALLYCSLIHSATDKDKLIEEFQDTRRYLSGYKSKFDKECEKYSSRLIKEFYN